MNLVRKMLEGGGGRPIVRVFVRLAEKTRACIAASPCF